MDGKSAKCGGDGGRAAVLRWWPVVGLALGWMAVVPQPEGPVGVSSGAADAPGRLSRGDRAGLAGYAGSEACRSCHREVHDLWYFSHHARAERALHPVQDREAFEPPRWSKHGTQVSGVIASNGLWLGTIDLDGVLRWYPVCRALGVRPLVQYLVPLAGGRLQATELAYDPVRQEWFNVFGQEDRKPGEWGHWTGRGMNWNSMCAHCHNTAVRKNYDAGLDRYATVMAERGVGCEACHGPMRAHVQWQRQNPGRSPDPGLVRLSSLRQMDTCASCHARQVDLTGRFRPGEAYEDHFWPAMVDASDVFYPDGQVRDENFEWAAFLGSKMYEAGVRCIDCHDPHSGRTRRPGNALCLQCHAPGAGRGAPAVDVLTHSRHAPGSAGDQCVHCHMPQTVYMQRHPRHDHGFTIPDPWLTVRFAIPNACNRCHTNQTATWALEHAQRWYGERLERPQRRRAEWVMRARDGDAGALEEIIRWLRMETNRYWRAVMLGLLEVWSPDPTVLRTASNQMQDASALVRVAAVRVLERALELGDTSVRALLQTALADSARSVRVAAAWALRGVLDTNHPAGRELLGFLGHHADQPWGQFQWGLFWRARGQVSAARDALERAVRWDPHSVLPRVALAAVCSELGEADAAVEQLREACRLAPEDAELRYRLGLAWNEAGRLEPAAAALEQAAELNPRHVSAWYNLGLARAGLGQTESALACLARAEALDARDARIPYARATLLAREGRWMEARAAAIRTLELDPTHAGARSLLRLLAPAR